MQTQEQKRAIKSEYDRKRRIALGDKLRAYDRARHKNPERRKQVLERCRKWQEENREYVSEQNRARYIANPEPIRARAKARYDSNLEVGRESRRRYANANRQSACERAKQWAKDNPEKTKDQRHKRKALVRGATVGKPVRCKEIYERDKWICQLCAKKVDSQLKYPDPMSASMDHDLPLIKGGKHEPDNCQLAHLTCNVRKKDSLGLPGRQLRLHLAA